MKLNKYLFAGLTAAAILLTGCSNEFGSFKGTVADLDYSAVYADNTIAESGKRDANTAITDFVKIPSPTLKNEVDQYITFTLVDGTDADTFKSALSFFTVAGGPTTDKASLCKVYTTTTQAFDVVYTDDSSVEVKLDLSALKTFDLGYKIDGSVLTAKNGLLKLNLDKNSTAGESTDSYIGSFTVTQSSATGATTLVLSGNGQLPQAAPYYTVSGLDSFSRVAATKDSAYIATVEVRSSCYYYYDSDNDSYETTVTGLAESLKNNIAVKYIAPGETSFTSATVTVAEDTSSRSYTVTTPAIPDGATCYVYLTSFDVDTTAQVGANSKLNYYADARSTVNQGSITTTPSSGEAVIYNESDGFSETYSSTSKTFYVTYTSVGAEKATGTDFIVNNGNGSKVDCSVEKDTENTWRVVVNTISASTTYTVYVGRGVTLSATRDTITPIDSNCTTCGTYADASLGEFSTYSKIN